MKTERGLVATRFVYRKGSKVGDRLGVEARRTDRWIERQRKPITMVLFDYILGDKK